MKNLLVLLLVLMTSTAAIAKDLTSYRFAVRSDVDGKTQIHNLVATVTMAATLRVEHTQTEGRYPFFTDSVGNSVELTKRLSSFTFESLKRNIIALSNAEIDQRFNQVVCMMMPGPVQSNDHLFVARGHDWNTGHFFGELELIHGPQGCWVSNKVAPKGGREELAAKLLKNQIKVITLEFLNL
jgi:hypothetical protein